MADVVGAYLRSIQKELATGKATEHTYRPALKALVESLQKGVSATNEPMREACGAPDLIVQRGQIPLGYIECKNLGIPLDDIEKSPQLQRYLSSLSNLILTNYLEFRLYVQGEWRMSVSVARIGSNGKVTKDNLVDGHLPSMFDTFFNPDLPVVGTPRDLA